VNAKYQRCIVVLLFFFVATTLGCAPAQEPGKSTEPTESSVTSESSESSEATVIEFYGTPDAGPAPLEVHFHPIGDDAVINTATQWAWDFGDGSISAENYASHIYNSDGTYTVTLTLTLADGTIHKATRAKYIRIAAGAKPTEDEEETPEQQQAEMDEEGETASVDEGSSEEEGSEQKDSSPGGANGAVFIHHSCGENWLNSGLNRVLLSKPYIDDRNDITYGTELKPDRGRPASLGSPAGDLTDMHHWILWFNDYFNVVRGHGCRGGANRIILFKSCFPNSHIDDAGSEPGDPFSDWRAIANYKALFRHPGGPGKTYKHEGQTYRALRDIFVQHPDTLFIPIIAPPECRQETNKAIAANARTFNNWLKNEWLPAYTRTTRLHNVAVFDWFDLLATSPTDSHPNQLRPDYGGTSGDSHPNAAANARSTKFFATAPDNFLDQAWQAFTDQ
jgi:PKD repeat protein